MSRAQTLVLALLVLHVLLGVLCLVIARGEHKSPALRWWGWGLLVYAAGLLVTIATFLGRPVSLTVGNALVTLAPVLCAMAVLSHTHYRLSWPAVWTGVAATVAVLAFNNFGGAPRPIANLVAPTVMAVVLFSWATYAIARAGPKDAVAASRFLAAMFILSIATWIARVAVMVLMLGASTDVNRVDLVISLFAILQMVNSVGAALSLMWIDVRLMQAELSRVAHSDALTGLPNRRGFMKRFDEELARASRYRQSFALAVFDLDHFKQVNDRFGHYGGDALLRAVAGAFSSAKRTEDVLGRVGGEEFLFLLAQPSREGAVEAAERLREAVSRTEAVEGGETIRATASAGIAMYPDDGADWESLFNAADRRLYEAKRSGRNRVVATDDNPSDRALARA